MRRQHKMKNPKEIRHMYLKHILCYLQLMDSHKLELADHFFIRLDTIADVLNRDSARDVDRIIRWQTHQKDCNK